MSPLFSSRRAHPLEEELLQPLAFVRFAGVQVALRIYCDAADAVKMSGPPSAGADARDDLERVTTQHPKLLIGPVGDVDKLLLRIVRERDIPDRALAERRFRHHRFPDERPVLLEDLNAIVATIADVNQSVAGDPDAAHDTELRVGRFIRIV